MVRKIKDKIKRKMHSLTLTVQFSTKDLNPEKTGVYDLIKIKGGGLTTRIGWPQLPVISKHFVLPVQAMKVTFTRQKEKWTRLPGHFTLAPGQPIRPANDSPPNEKNQFPTLQEPNPHVRFGRPGRLPVPPIPTPDGVEYQTNDVFVPLAPEAAKEKLISLPTAEIASISQVGGQPVVAIRFHPLRYSPRTRMVQALVQVEVQLKYSISRQSRKKIEQSSAVLGHDMWKLMSLVENPSDIGFEFPDLVGLDDVSLICPDDPLLKLKHKVKKYPVIVHDRIFIPPDVVLTPRKDWPYLIITDDYEWHENCTKGDYVGDLISEFEHLARWKTMKGVRARVISISDIVANKFGTHWQPGVTRDLPEAIRNFLKHAFKHWKTRWCLIGGDINIVPTRHVLGNSSWWYISNETDLSPDVNQAYYDSSTPSLRFQSSFDFTTDDVFFAVQTGEVIRYRDNATTVKPGWYWTDSDYSTPSSVPTRFVLIRGPSSLLTRTFMIPQYINMIPSDFYYSSVDSPHYSLPGRHDWDNDNNGIYGWYDDGNPDGVDFAADISIGRAPVNSTRSASEFIDKVFTYEFYRDVRSERPLAADYVRKLYCVGAVWGSNWWDGSFERIRWGELDGACKDKENVISKFRDMGLSADLIQRIYEDIYFVPRIESNLIVLDQSHLSQMRNLINDGPHFLSLSGHGWWDGCCGISSTDPSWVNVQGMNNWPHMAIYFVDSCLTNEFDLTHWDTYNRTGGAQAGNRDAVCLGKNLVRYGQGGAIGYLGYSRLGGVGNSREIDFWETLSLYGQAHLGNMQDRCREICKDYSSYEAYIMTLMGDPELSIFTQPPQSMTVSHTAFVYGKDRLTVSVYHKEFPKIDCIVNVCQLSDTDPEDKIYFDLVEAADGHYTFNTSVAGDGNLYITVTAKNFVPYTGSAVKVSQPVSPWKYRTGGFVYDLVRRSTSSIYAASGDTYLYALSPTSGLLWSINLAGPVQDLDAANDGSVLVGLRKNIPNNLRLFDKVGTQLHTWNLPQEIWCVTRDPAHNAAYGGLLDLGVYAYDTSTGAIRWTRNDLGSVRHIGLDARGNIYASVTGGNPKIVKLSSSTGSTIWSYDIGGSWPWESLALLVEAGGICYVSTRNHELHKIDSAGNLLWKKIGGSDVNNISTAVHSLAMFDTTLYAGSGDGVIHAVSADGTIAWKFDTGDRVDCLDVGVRGTVYAGCWHGICAVSPDGSESWFREVTGGVLSLVRVGDRLFGGSRDGWVYQIDIDDTIKLLDLVVVNDLVKLKDFVISGGGTRVMEFSELKKIIGTR
jgi:Peptidase family C25/PQQ-like domain